MIEFTPWPQIARLNRDITITEKIDGTNAAVGIVQVDYRLAVAAGELADMPAMLVDNPEWGGDGGYAVYAQSRKNIITPSRDNHGFARWVWDNAEALVTTLGEGVHFGEWWGSGIQRGYDLPKGEKRFSLFNTKRWNDPAIISGMTNVPGLTTVPVIYEGPFLPNSVMPPWIKALAELRELGSWASPGFTRPEGIVLYHHAANMMFKVTLEGDEVPKGLSDLRR